MESNGRKFYNSAGTEQEGMLLLKNLGMNTIRLRVWVNPAGGWNNKADVLAKATRAKNLGMRLMIDFHYSDTWADPGHQTKPAAWAAMDIAGLKSALSNHTLEVLNTLKANSITPEWVQVGNETNDGMLWPEGKASTNMNNFAQLVNAGYDAVKTVFPQSKVIVHVSNGFDNSLFRWLFDGLKNNSGKWDVIGMSLYPTPANWASLNNQCLANMHDMVSRFNKEVMVVEVGMSWDQPAASQSFLADIIAKTKSIPNNKGLGVLYWEPQSYNNWQGYTLGAFDNSGKPTSALNAFAN
jgi:arabinogalactan endo-1,4-beta-galactosidase